ncbi:alpha-galactosidase A precursor [mine drainage metagenome]|uniref:Alpha-galactosidase A n=1 Tax=mine drainage metagenome TaxID=410659 RepID=A0A1J5RQJ3_9ZZZZ
MNTHHFRFAVLMVAFAAVVDAAMVSGPRYWKWAATPPMGWNSYDAWGTSVNESEVLANARYMQSHLMAHGWKYVVIDARWYDSVSSYDDRNLTHDRTGARLYADRFGRLLPAPSRFPSAAGGEGFKPLADRLHAMGLKFGIHMMRGIPRQSVDAATPIEGSRFSAKDAGDPNNTCGWCPDMYGVRDNAAGQAWYDSCARLWASWGVDFVKVDDLSVPYSATEIAMIRKAIDRCGRPIVFSTSPGPTDPVHADDIKREANMWRISGDFWDRWPDLDRAFDLLARWQGCGGPGHWPDLDMIPFGHLGIKCTIAGGNRQSRFTRDEEVTLMSLWALAPSPLMLGANLPDTDAGTLSLLTNDEVIAVDQDPLGSSALCVKQDRNTEIWVKPLAGGARAIGLFNRSEQSREITMTWNAVGLGGRETLRNLWTHRDLGSFAATYSTEVPAHGAVLLIARP